MPSDSRDQRPTRPPQLGAPPPEPEHLPCPRCDSTNTKFCYYNNYNFSQPRHFCKSCRRYWTHGGTLRDIPVGGGGRKNAKRCRTTTSSPTSAGATQDHRHHHLPSVHDDAPVFLRLSAADHGGSLHFVDDGKPGLNLDVCGSFTSLLSNDDLEAPGTGLGLGPFEDMGFSVGRAVWSFPGVGDGGTAGSASTFGNTWQLDGGEGGLMGGGDCFALPDLAISTHLNVLK